MTTIDFRTASEQLRDDKHEKVCSMYTTLRNKYPKTAPSRIFMVIAGQVGMTSQGVRNIIIRNNLYQPSK